MTNELKNHALKELKRLADKSHIDAEVAHVKADEILLELINDEEIDEAYSKIIKWYA